MGPGGPIPGLIVNVRRSPAVDTYANHLAADAGSGTKCRPGKGAQPREVCTSARSLGLLGRFSQGLDLPLAQPTATAADLLLADYGGGDGVSFAKHGAKRCPARSARGDTTDNRRFRHHHGRYDRKHEPDRQLLWRY